MLLLHCLCSLCICTRLTACLQFVNSTTKVRVLPFVSKSFQRACKRPSSWHSLREECGFIIRRCRSGTLQDGDKDVVHFQKSLAEFFSLLRVVELPCESGFAQYEYDGGLADEVVALLTACPHVEDASLPWRDESLWQAATKSHPLEAIAIFNSWQCGVTLAGLARALPHLAHLKRFRIGWTSMFCTLHSAFQGLGPWIRLQDYTGSLEEHVVQWLSSCPSLTSVRQEQGLELGSCDQSLSAFVGGLGCQLVRLHLNCMGSDALVGAIGSHCRNLQDLKLVAARELTGQHVFDLGVACGKLEHVRFSLCGTVVSRDVLKSLIKMRPDLRSVRGEWINTARESFRRRGEKERR